MNAGFWTSVVLNLIFLSAMEVILQPLSGIPGIPERFWYIMLSLAVLLIHRGSAQFMTPLNQSLTSSLSAHAS